MPSEVACAAPWADRYACITWSGRTIISKKPDFSNRQFREAQLEDQTRTKQASGYASCGPGNVTQQAFDDLRGFPLPEERSPCNLFPALFYCFSGERYYNIYYPIRLYQRCQEGSPSVMRETVPPLCVEGNGPPELFRPEGFAL